MTEWEQRVGAARTVGPAARRLINGSLSENTRRVYVSQLRKLDAWLDGRELNDASLAEYVGWLYDKGVAVATPVQAVAACRYVARAAGAEDPCGALTRQALSGFRRDAEAQRRGRGQADGISAAEAAKMAALAAGDSSSLSGLRDAAVIAVMSDAMLRVSEASALRVGEVMTRSDASGRVRVQKGKTDPNGEGRTLYIGPEALRRYREWLDAAGIERGLAFRQIRKGGHVQAEGLTPEAVRRLVKERAKTAGIAKEKVSGQSLRIGMAQTLASAGASVVEMQLAGRWKSPQMPARYASGERAGRNAVARLVHGAEERGGAEPAGISADAKQRAMRVAEQFGASGVREGRLLARALREWAECLGNEGRRRDRAPMDARERDRAIIGPKAVRKGRSAGRSRDAGPTRSARRLSSDAQRSTGAPDVTALLNRLSEVAYAWATGTQSGPANKERRGGKSGRWG